MIVDLITISLLFLLVIIFANNSYTKKLETRIKQTEIDLEEQLNKAYNLFREGDKDMQLFYNELHDLVMLSIEEELRKEQLENIADNYNFYINTIDNIANSKPVLKMDLIALCDLHVFYSDGVKKYRNYLAESNKGKFKMVDLKSMNLALNLN